MSKANQTRPAGRAERKQRDMKTRELSRLALFNQPREQDITGDRNQTLEREDNNPRNVEVGQELGRKTGNPNNHKPEQAKKETLHDLAGSNRALSMHGALGSSDGRPRDRLAIFPDLGRFSKPWALANKTRLVAGIGALLLPLFVSIVFQGLSNMG